MELRTQRLQRSNKHRLTSKLATLNRILFVITFVVFVLLSIQLWRQNILTANTVIFMTVVGVFISLLIILFPVMFKKLVKTVTVVLLLLLGLLSFSMYRVQQVVGLFNNFSQSYGVSVSSMYVVALKDSDVKTLEQLGDGKVAIPTAVDNENINQLLTDIKSKKNVDLNRTDVSNYHEAYEKLVDGSVKAMVLSSAYESLLAQEVPDIADKIVRLYELQISKQVLKRQVETNQKTDVFHVYISGIDTYGPITEVSRSDVNIIATVNTTTNQILLTSTPRDAYVKIADGGKDQLDKLTHAGIYGVNASMHTLENLYGIKMDYFARVNFTTFMKLIDIVGGVDIDNPYEFKSYTIPGKIYPKGKLHLNAEDALGFVRERYNLVDGDVGRAANQEKVITQILQKLLSSKLLTESDAIIEQLAESVQSDMALSTVMTIINKLTNNRNAVQIHSQALEVTGQIGLKSYAMPGARLWMGVVNEKSLKAIKQSFEDVVSGKAFETSATSTTRNN